MFYTLPPELWEYIITDYHLYGLKYIKTIKMIPSRHCIIRTVYNMLIQPYIDHLCKLIYSTEATIKSHIFNKYNLIDIIEYFDITIEDLPKIDIDTGIFLNSIVLEYKNKKVRINTYDIEYYMNDNLHRIGGPAIYIFDIDGIKREEKYYVNNNRHRTNGPACIKWNIYGIMEKETYYINGRIHRTDGPAITTFYVNGSKFEKKYYLVGKLHRTDGPAIIKWNAKGKKNMEEYYLCGLLHRIDGPASIKWDDDGNIVKEEYYLTDQQYEEEEYYDIIDSN